MRRLHLFLPHLPLDLARARRSEPFPTGPLVLGGRPWDPGPVIDADPSARALGVRRGMPLGSAHRLVPEATFIDPDPEADRGAAEAVFEALGRSARVSRGAATRSTRRSGCSRSASTGSGRCGVPSPSSSSGSVERCHDGAPGCTCPATGRHRRHAFRGDDRRDGSPAGAAGHRPARRRGRVPRGSPVRPADHRSRCPRPPDPLRAAPDRRGGRAARCRR